jgi:hypothetical protein
MDTNTRSEIEETIKKILIAPPKNTCEESEQILYKAPAKKKKDSKTYYEYVSHYCWVLIHRIAEGHYTTPQAIFQLGILQGLNIWTLLVMEIINEAKNDEDSWEIADALITGLFNKALDEVNIKHTA